MTNEEAVKVLENSWPTLPTEQKAFVIAKEATEKQIHKKPNNEKKCPNCGNKLHYCANVEQYQVSITFKFCQECGQKIDWSSDKE